MHLVPEIRIAVAFAKVVIINTYSVLALEATSLARRAYVARLRGGQVRRIIIMLRRGLNPRGPQYTQQGQSRICAWIRCQAVARMLVLVFWLEAVKQYHHRVIVWALPTHHHSWFVVKERFASRSRARIRSRTGPGAAMRRASLTATAFMAKPEWRRAVALLLEYDCASNSKQVLHATC